MPGTCVGIRVLDLSRGSAGAMATMILADFGADVVIGARPGASIEDLPAYLLLQRGKRSATLDIDSPVGRDEVLRLLPGFDVLVEDWAPGAAEAMGLDDDVLVGVNGGLVRCGITPFGRSGPLAGAPADDWLVMARSGIFRDQPGWERDGKRPIYRSCPDGSYFAGMLAVQGILAALRARDITGRGQRVDASMLLAITCRQNPQVRSLRREGEPLPIDQAASTETVSDAINPLAHHRDPREVTLTGMLVQCKDGRWIMHSLSEPHFFPAWIKAIGFDWIWDDERFAGAPFRFPDSDTKGELVGLLQDHLRSKTSAEWMALYLENGNVCADVVQTTQQALDHPQVLAADDILEFDDPRVGPMVQVGRIAKLSGDDRGVPGPAPDPGQHSDEVRSAAVTPIVLPVPTRDNLAGPLDGITVVEAGYYYATPFATALLAELGARIIKIEPIKGDPYRLLGRGGGDPVAALGHNNMVRAMQGKESVALNLKDPRGQEALHRIVAGADLFVHSFRGRVPESLGLDEVTLRAVNPTLVYHYAASYGSVGPYRLQPAIDPVIAAFAGTTAYQTGDGNPPLRESGADPVAAAGHAVAMVLGLLARHRSGTGQSVESAMIVSNLYLNAEDAFRYRSKPSRPAVDSRQLGIGGAHRLYPCAPGPRRTAPHENPDPRWVMLAADEDGSFGRLCAACGRDEVASDARFATAGARRMHRAELEAVLESVFLTRTATDWESTLLAVGVGCVVADAMSHFAFLFEDSQARAIDMMVPATHPSFGRYFRYAPVLSFSATPSRTTTFCELGEHSRSVLRGVGFDDVDIDALAVDGVVGVAERVSA